MQNYKEYFKGKKVTVMGLGLLGRGVGDAATLAECGADLIVTDLKTKEQLQSSLDKLKKHKNIKYVLGEHRLEDFMNRDFILKAAGVPLDSIYIAEARKNNIPIEMSASLFAKLSGIPIIGVTGTRGKSTVTYMIEHILKAAGKEVLLGGNVRGVSTLSLLKKIKEHNRPVHQNGHPALTKAGISGKPSATMFAVFELDSWQLQGFADSSISPQIAVFTTFYSDHLNYYKDNLETYFTDKAGIFINQKKEDFLLVGKQAWPTVEKWQAKIKSQIIVPAEELPSGFTINIPGTHNEYNAMLAMSVAKCLGIKEDIVKKAIKTFKPVEGRLEYLRMVRGVKIYNDNNSTTPEATMVALKALDNKKKNIVLIIGGSDKKLDMSVLVKEIEGKCKKVILLPGTGSDKLSLKEVIKVSDLKQAVKEAMAVSKKGDTILFSPAFASFTYYANEYERNDQFVSVIKKLK
jgi:UDP-N-acetylmuramoylalanine--D-glutamate ligase